MFKRTDRETGFTLLELLYVMSIVAGSAGMLIPQLILQRARAIEISAQKRLQTIGSVMESTRYRIEGATMEPSSS